MDDTDSPLRNAFAEALEIKDAQQRATFLDRVFGKDSAMRREIEELIKADTDAGRFLPEQPGGSQAAGNPPEGSATLLSGLRVGRYKLLQKIGEGGFGVVYMAEQQEPVHRKVALKIIKLGLDTRQVVARFEAERQALALMDHPNIAKVLDAGATEAGRPYFVMELVRGISITRYCDENNLSTATRLGLFVQVARAIQHAHQKGIIHRDIKPSNVLVADHDGVPVPKIIDFGIAKATTDQRLTDKTLFTAFEQFMGTPAYMSPEQAKLSGLDIDTRTDIYSLGVLLYELLTGRTPFEAKRLLEAGLDEIRRIIREEEPARPSTRLQTLDAAEQTAVAKHRQSDPPKLLHLIRGDLDWIAMKCLEKDRSRRYETANALLMDIERHSNNEPVLARPPSQLYRFQKMIERNKVGFAAMSAVSASLIIGLAVSVWQYVEKSKSYVRTLAAESRERSAREEAQKAQVNEAQQRKEAEAVATHLAKTLNQLQLQNAEALFAADNSASAVAHLARLLRQNPTNQVAAQRLLSVLTYRNFALPVMEAIKHGSWVISAEFSPDGRRLVTASEDKTARVWDAITGLPLTAPLKHEADLFCASFSPDGLRVVTACGATHPAWIAHEIPEARKWAKIWISEREHPNYAQIWDATTGQPLSGRLEHPEGVSSAQFSPDGQRVATASYDSTLRIWDANSGRQLIGPVRAGEILISARFSPDGQRVVTAGFDGTAQVWDTSTGEPVGQPIKHDFLVTSVEFSPDGQKVLTACSYQVTLSFSTNARPNDTGFSEARVSDSNTGQALAPPMRHEGGVSSARFSADGLRVVTASLDKTARVWDAQTARPLTGPLRHTAPVFSAEFSPDGLRIVTASEDKTARVWDAKTGKPLTESLKHNKAVRSAHFSPDGQRVVTASDDGTARIWDIRARAIANIAVKHHSMVHFAQFSPDGKRLVTASFDTAIIWDAQSGRAITEPMRHDGSIMSATLSSDGVRVVTVGFDLDWSGWSARVWDAQTGRPLTDPLRHEGSVRFAQFSPDGLRIVTASQDKVSSFSHKPTQFWARIWDAQTGRPLTEPIQHAAVVEFARFSPDGKWLLTVSADGTARVWDAQSGQPVTEPLRHEGSVSVAQFSPDGQRVVTASADNTAQVWDAKTGHKLINPLKHEALVLCAQFSPDGQRIVTASADRTARLWDSKTGQPLTGPLLHDAAVTWSHFSPDGQRIVTTSLDKTVRIWDGRTGQPLTDPLQHEAAVSSAEFSSDGQRLVTVSGEIAIIWEVPMVPLPVPDWVAELAEAIIGNRLDDDDILEPVPFAVFQALQSRVTESSAPDLWTRWAKWLLADPANRASSPFSTATPSDNPAANQRKQP